MSHRGLTLIELVLFVAILLILGALFVPRLPSETQGVMDTRKVVHLLASDLRYTRRLALTNSVPYKLQVFNTSPKTYQIRRVSDNFQVDETREIPNTLAVSGPLVITFVATGGATANSTMTIAGPKSTYTVNVFQSTGSTQIK